MTDMKNILITGANGQLGNEMRLQSEDNKAFKYFFTDVSELDICDEEAVMRYVTEHEIDVIVNCAAYTAVDKAEDNVISILVFMKFLASIPSDTSRIRASMTASQIEHRPFQRIGDFSV